MAIQFLLVTFPEERAVLADGNRVGFTNHILMLPADEYEISLDGGGCQPASQMVALGGTSMVKPMVVGFASTVPVAVAAVAVVAEAAANAPALESMACPPDDAATVLVVTPAALPTRLPARRGAARKAATNRSPAAKGGAAAASGGSNADAAQPVGNAASPPRQRRKGAAKAAPAAAKKTASLRPARKAKQGG